jgi:hypothetical protein
MDSGSCAMNRIGQQRGTSVVHFLAASGKPIEQGEVGGVSSKSFYAAALHLVVTEMSTADSAQSRMGNERHFENVSKRH